MVHQWRNVTDVQAREYTCGYCGNLVGSNQGFYTNNAPQQYIYICPFCALPTFYVDAEQTPGVPFGGEVGHLSDDLAALYREARKCMSVSSFTAAVLTCRKILMNVAVDKGAPSGKRFIEYVNYLDKNNYLSVSGRDWVDHIRTKGNEANHEIHLMSEDDAKELIVFTEMLLKLVYEFPNRVPVKLTDATKTKVISGIGRDPKPMNPLG